MKDSNFIILDVLDNPLVDGLDEVDHEDLEYQEEQE